MNRVLESDELERVVIVAINSAHIQAALKQALESDGASQLIDSLFDSGLIDRFLAGLVDSGTSTGSSTGCWPARASGT